MISVHIRAAIDPVGIKKEDMGIVFQVPVFQGTCIHEYTSIFQLFLSVTSIAFPCIVCNISPVVVN